MRRWKKFKRLLLVIRSATPSEAESIGRLIAANDDEIDRLVYELYGLTEEEIRIVEGK